MLFQEKLYHLFEEPDKNKASYLLNIFIYILILISIVNLMLLTVSDLQERYGDMFLLIRNIIMPIFIIEYVLRLYASGALEKYKGLKGKVSYILTPYAMIDLVSILPFILIHFTGFPDSYVLRALRLLRIFRLLRVRKYVIFLQLMKSILKNIKEEIFVLIFYAFVLLIILAFIIFQVEHEAQPEVFTNIFQTMWWGVATLTTVGYGDMYPITTAGKIITSIITIMGIAFVAIPGGIFASEFITGMNKYKEKKALAGQCYRCGSNEVNSYDNAELIYSDNTQNYDSLHQCQECNFIWLEPNKLTNIN